MAILLPEAGYSPREVELICGVSYKYAYQLIRLGKLEAFTDSAGMVKVYPHSVYLYLREREKRAKKKK